MSMRDLEIGNTPATSSQDVQINNDSDIEGPSTTHRAPSTTLHTPSAMHRTPSVTSSVELMQINDQMRDDGTSSVHGNTTTTLTVSSGAQGKRKVTELEGPSDPLSVFSSMPPPSSSAPTTSAASSAKHRKIRDTSGKPKPESVAAVSMQSSRDSSKQAGRVSGDVRHQQILSRIDVMLDQLKPAPGDDDPLGRRQTLAVELLEADHVLFNLDTDTTSEVAMEQDSQINK
ncbi:hypothetical protein FIBSPDRAFT_955316 [Athelia psychrophila]|uniref:Uncharacterized protein n=1 Tax=Athelia psychrophila TaxID=1759441 RepID=A0A166IC40_9AGAM|nr:hypothetical protein FIBSPDRAFT_955316 [Fibularhizoctonia sp. CBS 109695]